MSGLKNISTRTFRKFLTEQGLKCQRKKGGHEIWAGTSTLRPVTFQSHIEPIPEFIIQNGLRNLGLTKENFIDWLKS